MRFVGNLTESEARNYRDKKYTHTEFIRGRDVNFYDCWTSEDEIKPTFGEELNQKKVRQIDRIIRENPPNDIGFNDSEFKSKNF